MKFMIAFACLLAAASAGYVAPVAPVAYASHGSHAVAYNAPLVSAPHPVPVAHTYAVAAPVAHHVAAPVAVAHHVAAPVAVAARSFGYQSTSVHPVGYAYAGPYAHGYAHHVAPVAHAIAAPAVPLATEARLIDPVAIAAGAPLPTGDTVEVAAAKAFHHAAHVEAKNNHFLAKGAHFIAKRSPGLLATGYAAPLAYTAPIHSYGYSAYAAPLAYSAYGYGHLGAYYG